MSTQNIHQICKSGCLNMPHNATIKGIANEFTFCCKLGAGKYQRQHAQFLKSIKKGIKFNFKPIIHQNK